MLAAVKAKLKFLADLIDVHCSTHLKKKKNFNPTPIKIIKLILFFFILLFNLRAISLRALISLTHSQFSQALISLTHQALHAIAVPLPSQPNPRHRRPRHLSSSHLSHLPAHVVAVPSQPFQPTPSPSHAVAKLILNPKNIRDEACSIRRSVFRYHSLPPSMMESPGSMKEERAAMV